MTDKIETVDYGKFTHIIDVEGNKIELWEPNDIEYEKLGEQMGSKTTKQPTDNMPTANMNCVKVG